MNELHPEQKKSFQAMTPAQKLRLLSDLYNMRESSRQPDCGNNARIGAKNKFRRNSEKFFFMPEHDLFRIFISRMKKYFGWRLLNMSLSENWNIIGKAALKSICEIFQAFFLFLQNQIDFGQLYEKIYENRLEKEWGKIKL